MIQNRIFKLCTLLTVLLSLSLFGCSKNIETTYDEIATYTTESIDGETYGEVHTIGAKQYYKNNEAPNYSIFKNEDDEAHIYSTRSVDEDLSFNIPEGDYSIVSKEIGSKDFTVSDSDKTLNIVLDYNNKEITVELNSTD